MGRRWVAGAAAVVCWGPCAALLGCVLAPAVASAIAGVLLVALAVPLARRLPARLDDLARRHRAAAAIWLVLVVAGAANGARVAYFMLDANATDASLLPSDEFSRAHSCLTAYYRAAVAEKAHVANVYDPTLYFGSDGDPPSAGMIGPFDVDPYEYPPPFLVPARAALAVSSDFMTWRPAWFGIEALLLIAALLALASYLDGDERLYALLLAPAVVWSIPALLTLQMGNFQLAAVSLAVLGLVAIERGRDVLGGSLLAAATVTKLFPGLLLVYLIARGRRRAAVAMTLAAVAMVAVTAAVVGIEPFRAFATFQLPRMADGSAFPWLEGYVPAIAVNHSIFGIVVKLRALGVAGMTFAVASKVAWVYTAGALAIAWLLGRRTATRDRGAEALVWLGLLQLGTLRSPFAPDVYATFLPVWIAALAIPRVRRGQRLVYAAAWIALNAGVLELTVTRPMGDGLRFALTGGVQAIGFALTYVALRPRRFTP